MKKLFFAFLTRFIRLARGVHPVKIDFFENAGGELLSASYEGPNIEKQIIPVNVMFYIK